MAVILTRRYRVYLFHGEYLEKYEGDTEKLCPGDLEGVYHEASVESIARANVQMLVSCARARRRLAQQKRPQPKIF